MTNDFTRRNFLKTASAASLAAWAAGEARQVVGDESGAEAKPTLCRADVIAYPTF